MATLGMILSTLAAIGFVLIGIVAIFQPAILSHLFGLYVHEANGRGFVQATGARDLAIGMMMLLFVFRVPAAVAPTFAVGGFLALCDLLIVWRRNGAFSPHLLFHAFGIVFLLGIATIVGITTPPR